MSDPDDPAEHIGDTGAIHDHDMIHDLGWRLDVVRRFDQDIANTRNAPHVREFCA